MIPTAFAAESSPFQLFDNNITAGYAVASSFGNNETSSLNANGQVLFDNNVWLNLSVFTKLTLSYANSSEPGMNQTLNNSAGSRFGIQGGYAFKVNNSYNVIPHIGFAYGNQLLAINEDSIQQFIIEDPSFNYSFGVKQELILIPKKLKFATDLGYNYSTHKAVLPNNTTGDLGHTDYDVSSLLITPELQWNVTDRLTVIGYYQYNYSYGDAPNFPNVDFSNIGVNSSQVIKNNYSQNLFGINFGFLF